MSWIEEFKSQIDDVFKDRDPVKKNTEPERKPIMQNKENTVLYVVILLLVCGTLFVWRNKANPPLALQSPMTPWQQGPQTSPPGNSDVTTIAELKKKYEAIDSAAQKIWERTKWNNDRIVLLANVNNHNLYVIKENLPKTELIHLNADWTIDRLPDHIALKPEDQEFLKKFLSK